jgi:hypothetical protein
MTNSSNTRTKVRTSNAKVETLGLPRPTMSARNRLVIGIVVVAVAVTTAIGFTSVLIPTVGLPSMFTSKECMQTPVKMFDENNVPKYFVGPDYKITPINVKATEVTIEICR